MDRWTCIRRSWPFRHRLFPAEPDSLGTYRCCHLLSPAGQPRVHVRLERPRAAIVPSQARTRSGGPRPRARRLPSTPPTVSSQSEEECGTRRSGGLVGLCIGVFISSPRDGIKTPQTTIESSHSDHTCLNTAGDEIESSWRLDVENKLLVFFQRGGTTRPIDLIQGDRHGAQARVAALTNSS